MSDTGKKNGCRQADEMLVDYLYGELDQDGRQAFEQHLAGCPEHREQVRQLQAVLEMVRADNAALEIEDVAGPVLQQARRQLAQRPPARRSWWLQHWQPLAAAAAAGLVAVVVGVLSWQQLRPRPSSLTDTVTIDGVVARQEEKATALEPAAAPLPARAEAQSPQPAGEQKDKKIPRPDTAVAAGRVTAASKSPAPRPARVARKRPRRQPPAKREVTSTGDTGSRLAPEPRGGLAGADAQQVPAENRHDRDEAASYRRKEAPVPARPAAKKKSRVFAPPPAATAASASPAPAAAGGALDLTEEEAAVGSVADVAAEQRPRPGTRTRRAASGKSVADDGQKQAGALEEARRLLGDNRPRQAARLLQQYIDQAPAGRARNQALFLLARAWMNAGDCRRQVAAASRALGAAPAHPLAAETLLDQASCLVKLQRLAAARRAYQRVLERYPARAAEAREGLRLLDRLQPGR